MWNAILDHEFDLLELDTLGAELSLCHLEFPNAVALLDNAEAWLQQLVYDGNRTALDHLLPMIQRAAPALRARLPPAQPSEEPELLCCLDNPADEAQACWRSLPPAERAALQLALEGGRALCEQHKLDLLAELADQQLPRLLVFRYDPVLWLLNSAKRGDAAALLGFLRALKNLPSGADWLAELALALPWCLDRLALDAPPRRRPSAQPAAPAPIAAPTSPAPRLAPSPVQIAAPSPVPIAAPAPSLAPSPASIAVPLEPRAAIEPPSREQLADLAQRWAGGKLETHLDEWIDHERCDLPRMGAGTAWLDYLARLDAAACQRLGQLIEAYGSQCAKERAAIEALRLEAHFFRQHVECPCCREDVAPSSSSVTSCAHVFHADCLARWLERSRRCPVCRTEQ